MVLFHDNLEQEIKGLIDQLKKRGVSLSRTNRWIRKYKPSLKDINHTDVQLLRKIKALHRKYRDNHHVSLLLISKVKLLHLKLIMMAAQETPSAKETAIINAMVQEIEEIYQQEIAWENAYERLVVSTPDVVRFLHRTSIDNAKMILSRGFRFNGNLTGTATMCSRNLEEGKLNFFSRHKSCTAVVVIEVPKNIYNNCREKEIAESSGFMAGSAVEWATDVRISSKIKNSSNYLLHPLWIHAYIDRTDNHIHMNPKFYKK